MSETMTTSEVLNRAADIIEERGWAKGKGWYPDPDSDAPVCAEGAIRLAVDGNGFRKQDVSGTLGRYLLDAHPDARRSMVHGGVIVFAWNDSQESAAPVIEALRACAVIEAARERQAVSA